MPSTFLLAVRPCTKAVLSVSYSFFFSSYRHRHASDHQCPSLDKSDPKEERRRAAQEKLHKTMPAIAKTAPPAVKATKPKPKPSKKVQEMKMKMSAKVSGMQRRVKRIRSHKSHQPLHTVPLAARLYLYAAWEGKEEPVYCSKVRFKKK